MKIDPKAYRPAPQVAAPSTDPTALLALAVEVECLAELSEWEPVGLDLENLTLSMRGEDGITTTTILRLRRRARAWGRLNQELRAFFVAHVVNHAAPRLCLLHALDEAPSPPGWAVGMTRRLYEAHTGHPCPFNVSNLLPRSPR